MRAAIRWARRGARGALVAALLSLCALPLSLTDAGAQGQAVDPRRVSLNPQDLSGGFSVVEGQTAFEPLRIAPSTSEIDVVGVTFRTVMERAQTLEHLQSGPIRVGQLIARSDDPTRATFSLDAQREFNVREHGFEVMEAATREHEILCLVRRDGPFVEYRIVAVRNADTLVSTTSTGLPSAVDLEDTIALMNVSLARYDGLVAGALAATHPPAAGGDGPDAEVRAVKTPTPASPPPAATAPPASTPATAATAQSTARVKLPSRVDDRLAQPWSELMNSTATTKSGEKVSAFLRRVIESTDVKVTVGDLRTNVGGELRSVAKIDGDKVTIVDSEITVNKDVMNEDRRVLAAILAHEITHASQPVMRSNGDLINCIEAEVEAYAIQAKVWSAFWGEAFRPGQTKWERSMNYVEETWKRSGENGLRSLVREETSQASHSCIG
jgi:hypothetical protein